MNSKSLYIRCDCNNSEHLAVLDYGDFGDEDEVVYLSFHLSPLPFFKRVLYGIKYIFGHQSDFGAFGEIVINRQTQRDIVDFLIEIDNK